MANYRQIHVSIWKDEWFLELEPKHKLLFIYLFSNELASLSGIYKIPLKVIQFETDLPMEFITSALAMFERADKAYYQDGILWVKNLRKYNKGGATVQTRIENDVKDIPDCNLKRKYWDYYYPDIPYEYSIDRVDNIMNSNNNEMNDSHDSFPPILQSIHAQVIFSEISKMITIPNGRDKSVGDAIEQICQIRKKYKTKSEMVADGKRFFDEWVKRKYRKTNLGWIDWWIADELPPNGKDKVDTKGYTHA